MSSQDDRRPVVVIPLWALAVILVIVGSPSRLRSGRSRRNGHRIGPVILGAETWPGSDMATTSASPPTAG